MYRDYSQKELNRLYKLIPERVKIKHMQDFDPGTIAGCDVSYREVAVISCVAWNLVEEKIKEEVTFEKGIPAEYIPGKFALREFPLIKKAINKISSTIDCLIVDGHGIAHPDRAGLACFCGVLLDLPTFGCAKNLLIGEYEDIGRKKGNYSETTPSG